MSWPTIDNLPKARTDGNCTACERKPSITRDGRYCRQCLSALVRTLSPGKTRNYPTKPGSDGAHSGTHILTMREREADRPYWTLMNEGRFENAIRALEG
jgi:hypothetical protein